MSAMDEELPVEFREMKLQLEPGTRYQKPDPNTLAWWKRSFDELMKVYRGVCHLLNLAVANTRDNTAQIRTLQDENKSMRQELENLKADMGELRGENIILREELKKYGAIDGWVAGMRTWARQLQKSIPNTPEPPPNPLEP